MSASRKAVVTVVDTVVEVSGYNVADVMREHGLKPLWSRSARAWVVDCHHADDIVAQLEHSGYVVRIGVAA